MQRGGAGRDGDGAFKGLGGVPRLVAAQIGHAQPVEQGRVLLLLQRGAETADALAAVALLIGFDGVVLAGKVGTAPCFRMGVQPEAAMRTKAVQRAAAAKRKGDRREGPNCGTVR